MQTTTDTITSHPITLATPTGPYGACKIAEVVAEANRDEETGQWSWTTVCEIQHVLNGGARGNVEATTDPAEPWDGTPTVELLDAELRGAVDEFVLPHLRGDDDPGREVGDVEEWSIVGEDA